jgi:hypothetical protein
MIDDYRFGHIVIDGKEYKSDVKIFPGRVEANWWRTLGHSLEIKDISDILQEPPEVLIIGTGSAGVLKVPEDVQVDIKKRGIELIIERTGDACNIYNNLALEKRVVAALHLTC